jgi:hypothetical protein
MIVDEKVGRHRIAHLNEALGLQRSLNRDFKLIPIRFRVPVAIAFHFMIGRRDRVDYVARNYGTAVGFGSRARRWHCHRTPSPSHPFGDMYIGISQNFDIIIATGKRHAPHEHGCHQSRT